MIENLIWKNKHNNFEKKLNGANFFHTKFLKTQDISITVL